MLLKFDAINQDERCIETLYDNNQLGWIGVVVFLLTMMYALNVSLSPTIGIYWGLTNFGVFLLEIEID